MIKILPSILTADYLNLAYDIEIMKNCGMNMIHIDVMDGTFVPNITFGHKLIADIKKHFDVECDAHLMVAEPEKHIDAFLDAGAGIITVHVEASSKIDEIIDKVKKVGAKIGVALNPDTDVQVLKKYADKVDMFLVMSVFPGRGGQKLILETLDKIEILAKWREENNLNYNIEIDGGVKKDNIDEVIKCGANMIVVGSGMYENGELRIENGEWRMGKDKGVSK